MELNQRNLFVLNMGSKDSQQITNVSCKDTYGLEQTKARKNLQNRGIFFMEDGCTAKLADSFVNGEYLELCIRCIKNDGNQLVYVLFETDGVYEYGIDRRDQMIKGKTIENQRIEIDNLIKSFTGVYDNAVSTIKVAISIIHKYRLLRGLQVIHNERLPIGLVINNFKEWILMHALDSRVGITELGGDERIVLLCPTGYKNGKAVGAIFKEIFYELAPDNNFETFKAELFRRNMLICDRNEQCMDIQKTISKGKGTELGTDRSKIICFNFEHEFVNQVKIAREDVDSIIELSDEEIERMFDEGDLLKNEYGSEI